MTVAWQQSLLHVTALHINSNNFFAKISFMAGHPVHLLENLQPSPTFFLLPQCSLIGHNSMQLCNAFFTLPILTPNCNLYLPTSLLIKLCRKPPMKFVNGQKTKTSLNQIQHHQEAAKK